MVRLLGKRVASSDEESSHEDKPGKKKARTDSTSQKPTRKPGGRPSKKQQKQRRSLPVSRESTPPSTLQPAPETPDAKQEKIAPKKAAAFSPHTARTIKLALLSRTLHAPLSELELDSEESEGERDNQKSSKPLNKLAHLPGQGWKKLGFNATLKLYQTFETWVEKIFEYIPADMSTTPPSKSVTGIKSAHSIQSILLWSHINGVGLDSSYRHKNENRAPVTFLTTVDQNDRMLPGPVYVSANATATTITSFLRRVKTLVEDMAKDIVEGNASIHRSHLKFEEQMCKMATIVTKSQHGWIPLFAMIDKSKAKVRGIRNGLFSSYTLTSLNLCVVWASVRIRICQFHVIQAILRWERDHDLDKDDKRVILSVSMKDQLLQAFRELQRCPSSEDWEAHVAVFERAVELLASNKSAAREIKKYFRLNWFNIVWRDLWSDIGLPVGHNRDKISTNNWTERAFKTFDQVFLENRANKSIYRLVLILANEWLPYYEHWQLETKKVDTEAFRIAAAGYRLWNTPGAIIPRKDDEQGRQVWHVLNVHNSRA
ncbi:hypothetical protein C8F01DRAFT_1127692 [Mycena amicta]|nr:hypothetical protein C8F01DRAFT_1127692 [Mycena amicta]